MISSISVSQFGVTARAENCLSVAAGADLFEIKPNKPYTKADLDWMNPKSRSSVEMKDSTSRPAIAETCAHMEQYDTIFLGFPIWWYVAPTIINTFLESYDLSGKIIIPFATSGGSGMGNTNAELEPSCKGATLKNGKRFSPAATESELMAWSKIVE